MLVSLDPHDLVAVMAHPAQAWSAETVATLLGELRHCAGPADYFDFQDELFHHVIEVDKHRAQVSRNLKRTKRGKPPADGAPTPDAGRDPAAPATWRIEDLVFERTARQLRAVGDALAWRVSGFDRRYITALSQNAPPGPMSGKTGLKAERDAVRAKWKEHGRFALLHDLTSCLRIADLTEFFADGHKKIVEIKTTATKNAAQSRRMQAAANAVNHGAPLPLTAEQLIESTRPYETHLSQFADVIDLASQRGTRGMKVPGGRALIGMDVEAVLKLERFDDPANWAPIFAQERASTLKRAKIERDRHHASMKSADWASRSPVAVPYGIYPISPAQAAAVICDLAIVETVMSLDALVNAGAETGLEGEILLPDSHGDLTAEPVARFRKGDRSIVIHGGSMGQLLAELIDLTCFFDGVHELLGLAEPPSAPLLVYAAESSTWR